LDGEVGHALEVLEEIESRSGNDPVLMQQIAESYMQCGQFERAEKCYGRSVALKPSNPDYVFNLAAAKIALGEIENAESLFNRVIKLNPEDYGAWLNRSALSKQTAQSNHVRQLKFVKEHLGLEDPGNIQICYALAKELEDLQRYDESFQYLQEGSVRRRQGLQYDVQDDVDSMEMIARHFDHELLNSQHRHHATKRPIFVLGLPRSGTTLVDRIISSHSQVASLGETKALVYALSRESGAASGKAELIKKSACIDFAALGSRYCEAIDGYGDPASRLVDKTPLNYLYLGLIFLAMPDAKIIHLRRNPMDSCYAIYKTLFRAGYPFSYSLQDVGRYYIAYRELMDHWRKIIPGSFLDVDYESLVSSQESETRRILEYCGLEWEDACLDFHRHSGPAATASAAQVRQPMYSSSVNLWRKYARQLKPFGMKLQEHGIDID
jgi:tetratricopeptide (TPR) repeat protein